jgi:hypothetical protein
VEEKEDAAQERKKRIQKTNHLKIKKLFMALDAVEDHAAVADLGKDKKGSKDKEEEEVLVEAKLFNS